MPHIEQRPPGPGDIRIPRARARPLRLGFRRAFVPRVTTVVTRVWHANPWSVYAAQALGDLYGRGISGHAGTIASGASRNGAGRVADPSVGWSGYTAPPQLFTGWNPAYQMTVGTPIKGGLDGLPNTSLPAGGPLDSAMAQIMQGQR